MRRHDAEPGIPDMVPGETDGKSGGYGAATASGYTTGLRRYIPRHPARVAAFGTYNRQDNCEVHP